MLLTIIAAQPASPPVSSASSAPVHESPSVASGTTTVPSHTDAAKLTLTEHVRQLRQEGDQAVEISQKLAVPTSEVIGDLLITTTFPQLLATISNSSASFQ